VHPTSLLISTAESSIGAPASVIQLPPGVLGFSSRSAPNASLRHGDAPPKENVCIGIPVKCRTSGNRELVPMGEQQIMRSQAVIRVKLDNLAKEQHLLERALVARQPASSLGTATAPIYVKRLDDASLIEHFKSDPVAILTLVLAVVTALLAGIPLWIRRQDAKGAKRGAVMQIKAILDIFVAGVAVNVSRPDIPLSSLNSGWDSLTAELFRNEISTSLNDEDALAKLYMLVARVRTHVVLVTRQQQQMFNDEALLRQPLQRIDENARLKLSVAQAKAEIVGSAKKLEQDLKDSKESLS
jgi:hypothetical protein